MNHLAEREREKKEEGKKKEEEEKKKKKKKELSTESNLGPLILRDIGRYAYNSEGVSGDTLKGPGENTDPQSIVNVVLHLISTLQVYYTFKY